MWLWVRRYLDIEANLAAVNYKDEVRAKEKEVWDSGKRRK